MRASGTPELRLEVLAKLPFSHEPQTEMEAGAAGRSPRFKTVTRVLEVLEQ